METSYPSPWPPEKQSSLFWPGDTKRSIDININIIKWLGIGRTEKRWPWLSSGVGDTKRAMIGEPRALPYITSGEIDQGDDTIFASESFTSITSTYISNSITRCMIAFLQVSPVSHVISTHIFCFWNHPHYHHKTSSSLFHSYAAIIAATTAGAVFAVLGVGYCYHRWGQFSTLFIRPILVIPPVPKTHISCQSFSSVKRRGGVRVSSIWGYWTSQGGDLPTFLHYKICY